ncbi:MAG TPA: biosynthetic peptidoglycan transglycosylase [Bacteroidia bacterium]|nr:biosynthetic peptidoglycan transglycosylase [Bacteroidia bacterium]
MVRKATTAFIICTILVFAGYFLFRNAVLHFVLHKVQEKIKTKYEAGLIIGRDYFSGFSSVNLDSILLIPLDGDTLLKINHIAADISFFKLIAGRLPYKNLSADTIAISLIKKDSADNYSAFLKGKKTEEPDDSTQHAAAGYGTVFNNLLNKLFNFLSGEITVNRLTADYFYKDEKRHFIVPNLYLKSREFDMVIIDSSFEKPVQWNINGMINRNERSIQCNVVSGSEMKKLIPFINSQSEFKYMLDSFSMDINSCRFEDDRLTIDLSYQFKNLRLNHWRVGEKDVKIDSLKFNGHLFADENRLGFDTSSFLEMNKMLFNFSSYYSRDSGKIFSLKVDMPETDAQDFFESLPGGMFKTLEGIKAKGQLSYHLDFKINKSNPDSLVFESDLNKYDFKITKYGSTYFPEINGSFVHTAYNDRGPVRTFLVGVENSWYTPLALISEKLKNAVLTSEDGAFYGHRGFNEEAFRQSIATNVKAGRFLRGGSTISMQLVKNVFLSRNKTVSRKIEEALIVWLIENNYIVSKDRMFEVYLNIIEWGPDVYGINEAADFYYGKKPIDLDLPESIYLASIIPHPKYFKYSFDSAGNLKPFIAGYYRLIANHLLRKEKITQTEFDSLQPTVRLNGRALEFILPKDTMPVDSSEEF